VGAELTRRAEGTGVRIGLIRRVGRHATTGNTGPRTVLIATTRPGAATVHSLAVADPRELLDLDLDALGAGRLTEGTVHPAPVILVCTNGKRDQCCAILGRSLALDIAESPAARGMELWEADHLGGHRLAPTAVVLPTGYAYGRLDAATALAALDAAERGEMTPGGCRGRSTWSGAGQAADLALRAELAEYGADAVAVLGEQPLDADHDAVDLLADGVTYRAVVSRRAAAEPRPESCGKAFGNPIELRVDSVEKRL
jgi:hypothetical protein